MNTGTFLERGKLAQKIKKFSQKSSRNKKLNVNFLKAFFNFICKKS
jgi:hypothetical protein